MYFLSFFPYIHPLISTCTPTFNNGPRAGTEGADKCFVKRFLWGKAGSTPIVTIRRGGRVQEGKLRWNVHKSVAKKKE